MVQLTPILHATTAKILGMKIVESCSKNTMRTARSREHYCRKSVKQEAS